MYIPKYASFISTKKYLIFWQTVPVLTCSEPEIENIKQSTNY